MLKYRKVNYHVSLLSKSEKHHFYKSFHGALMRMPTNSNFAGHNFVLLLLKESFFRKQRNSVIKTKPQRFQSCSRTVLFNGNNSISKKQ